MRKKPTTLGKQREKKIDYIITKLPYYNRPRGEPKELTFSMDDFK